MTMWFNHYLAECRKQEVRIDFDKAWLIGALLIVGDVLRATGYFGHAPEAEIIRHLRNSVAHGNRFNFHPNITDRATRRLRYPANIFRYDIQLSIPRHEVETNLQGTETLFVWGGPDAVIDCLTALSIHMWNVGHGIAAP